MTTRARCPHRTFALLLAAGLAAAAIHTGQPARAADPAEPQVIELTQVACQFLESENGVDHDFQTAEKADCEAVNADTGATTPRC